MTDRGVGRVGRDEDPIVRRRCLASRGEARQADTEAETEQDPGTDYATPLADQPPTRDPTNGTHHPGPRALGTAQAVTSVL
jgi:hypothetical protein